MKHVKLALLAVLSLALSPQANARKGGDSKTVAAPSVQILPVVDLGSDRFNEPYVYVRNMSMTYSRNGGTISSRSMIFVVDQSGQPVAGAKVGVYFSGEFGAVYAIGVTDASGVASLPAPQIKGSGLIQTNLSAVVASGYVYDYRLNLKEIAALDFSRR